MSQTNMSRDFERATQIVRDCGGEVVGRTKLQKVAYLLEATGLGDGFAFEYRHYGPYSEQLTTAVRSAQLFDLLDEEERATSWGGTYSIFKVRQSCGTDAGVRGELARIAVLADAIELELAATAAFLASDGHKDAWAETARRKPQKATARRVDGAKALYKQLQKLSTPKQLPAI